MYRKVLPALLIIAATWSIVSIPTRTFAALGAGDAMCAGCNPTDQKDPKYCPKVHCGDTTSGFSTAQGTCLLPTKCNTSVTGAGGDILKMLMQALLQKMMQSGQQSSSASTPTTGTCTTDANGNTTCSNGCTSYYQTTDASNTDPCAYYVPDVSNLLNSNTGSSTSDLLLNAFGGEVASSSLPNVSDLLNQAQQPSQPAPPTPATTTQSTAPASNTIDLSKNVVHLTSGGVNGNIEVTSKGGTIYANSENLQTNTAVAGFYGGDTFGNQQPKSLVARMCISRPWTGSIVSKIIPDTFFDGLCKWAGYQVGVVTGSQGPVVQYVVRRDTSVATSTATTTQTVPAKVQIWAVPASVPLGARTSIFWTTQGVASCMITSPDGSFNEHSLSGGASTVPLTGATTFTISCLTPDNKPVTGYTTVNLSI